MARNLRGADVLGRCLCDAGVKHVFTLSGNHIMPVFDACLDLPIQLIHVRHEAAAVHMADAWGRLTGLPGVALVTAGPGMANCLSALYVAHMAESPLVLLSGQSPSGQAGRGAFQEMAQAEMASHVTKASWSVADVSRLAEELHRARALAASGRPGPVHVALPVDVLEADARRVVASAPSGDRAAAAGGPLADPICAEVLQELSSAARPLVVAGPAMMRHAAGAAAESLARAIDAPLVGMESPRGLDDPCLGAFLEVLPESDLLLLLGKKLDFTLLRGKDFGYGPQCRLIQIDAEAACLSLSRRQLGPSPRIVATVRADPTRAAQQLAALAPAAPQSRSQWVARVEAAVAFRPPQWDQVAASPDAPPHPLEVCRAVNQLVEDGPAVFVSDGGEFGQWAQACIRAPRRVINGPSGAIGAALPFALAARLAVPQANIVATLGDGTFGFHALEFDTAVRYELPFIAVVGNDATWNAEYQIQLRRYGPERAVGCELRPTRYDELTRALGAHGEHVQRASELTAALRRAAQSRSPACVNVNIQRCAAPTPSA